MSCNFSHRFVVTVVIYVIFRVYGGTSFSDGKLMSVAVFDGLVTLDVLAGVTSILSLSAISVERMTAVKFPHLHIHMTRKLVLITIITTWICGLALSQCMHLATTFTHIKIYTAVVFTCGFAVPLAVIVIAYAVIYHTARHMIVANVTVKITREIRLAKTISLVIGLFLVCWTPFFVINMVSKGKSLKTRDYFLDNVNFFILSLNIDNLDWKTVGYPSRKLVEHIFSGRQWL